ncbi:DUF805 domain-containing protein [Lacticaseibacillus jixianensis]|uniref:DUF805 domain-containing protein n=1 Tax=Lacticaseibacillus jixianensis TaxID=2486012 RepID=A0ABW4B6I3_9LACO|nr:DUF805 domain-containing protein [Lacticaseibacillus jixianensis]
MAIKSNAQAQSATGNRYYRATGWTTIKAFFSNYINFTGRSSRSEYWWMFLFAMILGLAALFGFLGAVIGVVAGASGAVTPQKLLGKMGIGLVIFLLLLLLFFLIVIIPAIALTIRRYRDTGVPWWIYLIQVLINIASQYAFPADSTIQRVLLWAVQLTTLVLTLLPSVPLPENPDGPEPSTAAQANLDARIDSTVFAAPAKAQPADNPAPADPDQTQPDRDGSRHDDPNHPYTEG